MSDALSFAEIAGQRVELLPVRTVMSVFSTQPGPSGPPGNSGNEIPAIAPTIESDVTIKLFGNGAPSTSGSLND